MYGRALLYRGLAAFDELRQSVKDIEFLLDPAAGELRIGATEPLVMGLVPAIIDRLSPGRRRDALAWVASGDYQQETADYAKMAERLGTTTDGARAAFHRVKTFITGNIDKWPARKPGI